MLNINVRFHLFINYLQFVRDFIRDEKISLHFVLLLTGSQALFESYPFITISKFLIYRKVI